MANRKIKLIEPIEDQVKSFGRRDIVRFDNILLDEIGFRLNLLPFDKTGKKIFYFWGNYDGTLANVSLASADVCEERLPSQIRQGLCAGFIEYGFDGGTDYAGFNRENHYIVGTNRKLKDLYVKWMKNINYGRFRLYPIYEEKQKPIIFLTQSERREIEYETNLSSYFSKGLWFY